MKRNRWLSAMVAGGLALATAASAELLKTGKPAPTWSGKTVVGKAISSSQFKRKVVLMNFFSYT